MESDARCKGESKRAQMCRKPSSRVSSTCTLGERIQNCIHAFFYKWGHFVGRKPWTVIGASTFVVLICMIRLLFPIEEEAATSPPTPLLASARPALPLRLSDTWPPLRRSAPSTSSRRRTPRAFTT